MPRKSLWARLPFGVRMAIAGLGVLALVAGAVGGIVALTGDDTRVVTAVGRESPAVDLPAEVPRESPSGETGLGNGVVGHAEAEQDAGKTRSAPVVADRTATRGPRRATPAARGRTSTRTGAAPAAPRAARTPAAPQVRTGVSAEAEAIPFRTRLVRDSSLAPGTREIESPGVPGQRLLRYKVTYTGDKETGRRLLDSTVTRQPQDRVVAFADRVTGDQDDDSQDGDDQHGDRHSECRLLGSCVPMGSEAVCTDGDLSPLDTADLDELELTLPCEDDTAAEKQK